VIKNETHINNNLHKKKVIVIYLLNQQELDKILKVRTYSLLLFSKRNPVAKKPFMSRVGKVVITDG
jgi:hypothetical protein